jgi:DHA1 family bicyclomycin/chloramphenicol resistance-like MFS transporter
MAANALGIVAAGAVNDLLLRRVTPLSVVLFALASHAVIGAGLWGLVAIGLAGTWTYAAGLWLGTATIGLTFGNLTALTMARAGEQAGTASALSGVLQMAFGAGIAALAAALEPGPRPLPIVFVVCGTVSLLCCLLAARASGARTPGSES